MGNAFFPCLVTFPGAKERKARDKAQRAEVAALPPTLSHTLKFKDNGVLSESIDASIRLKKTPGRREYCNMSPLVSPKFFQKSGVWAPLAKITCRGQECETITVPDFSENSTSNKPEHAGKSTWMLHNFNRES